MAVRLTTRTILPTESGTFELRAFEGGSGDACLALIRGEVAGQTDVLTRVHSECLTGDSLGSLRCDCGVQLRTALKAIAAEGCGVVVYAVGHEGRGIGILNKLRAYSLQDDGVDTLDANLKLGLPADARRYQDAADVLRSLQVSSVRLLTNNPDKVAALEGAGISITSVHPMTVASHARNVRYLRTKKERFGHSISSGAIPQVSTPPPDVDDLLGPIEPHPDRPYVTLKFAQTLDGRIATRSGDARWISSEEERVVTHALRAHCDAILVGRNTAANDDPLLTVRLVNGSSPTRVVLDSKLSLPPDARVFGSEAPTILITTPQADLAKVRQLMARGVEVMIAPSSAAGVDVTAALQMLRRRGIESLLVEGGAAVITSFLDAGAVDRLIVSVAPRIMGAGIDAVGELNCSSVTDALRLSVPSVHLVGGDVVMAFSVLDEEAAGETASEESEAS